MTKVLYTAEATVQGGRMKGHGRTSDGMLDVQLRPPRDLGGEEDGTNPEQLFAVGYAACFESALQTIGRRLKLEIGETQVASRVSLVPAEDRTFALAVELDVTLPGLESEQAVKLTGAAHRVCPYSNATRGNVEVRLTANGQPVG
jgi:Ohr subfamily peroxiredoxin